MATSILKARIELNSTALERGLKNMRRRFNDLAATGLKAGGVAIAAGLAYSVKKAADLELGLAKVNTLLPKMNMDELKESVQSLSSEFGISATDAVEGLYQTISAGVTDPVKAMEFMRTAAELSVGGFVSMEDSVNALSKTMNSFGLTTKDVAGISDLLFQTVKVGQTNMQELAGTVGSFTGLAKSLGFSLEDTLGVFAQLTTTQGSTEEAATALRGIFTGLLKPSSELEKVMRKLKITQEEMGEIGLHKTLTMLRDATAGNNQKLAEMFANVRGLNGVLGVTGDNAGRTAEKLMLIGGSGCYWRSG